MSNYRNPHYQTVHIFPYGKEKIVDRVFKHYTAGELFKELFNEYKYVYLKYKEHYGPIVYRFERETCFQDAIHAIGAHGDVLEIYADNHTPVPE